MFLNMVLKIVLPTPACIFDKRDAPPELRFHTENLVNLFITSNLLQPHVPLSKLGHGPGVVGGYCYSVAVSPLHLHLLPQNVGLPSYLSLASYLLLHPARTKKHHLPFLCRVKDRYQSEAHRIFHHGLIVSGRLIGR